MQRKTAAHVHLDAIRENLAIACSLAPQAQVIAVIKADGYGHGILRVAESLKERVSTFAVATIDEAMVLRDAGLSNAVLVLEGVTSAESAALARTHDLLLMVHTAEQIALAVEAKSSVWIKLDTGMHRLGFEGRELPGVLQQLQAADVDVQAICTHLACADEVDSDATRRQLDSFQTCTVGCDLPLSIANSAAIIAWPDAHADWVRPGIMLYGASPIGGEPLAAQPLQPAMTFSAQVIAVRKIAVGESVGYGAHWTCKRESLVATVGVGYADGYPRHARNGTPVFVGGGIAPLVGSVSMDMITVDVTDRPLVSIGDTAELWGRNVLVSEVAASAGTISYNLLTGVSSRVPRLYS